MADIPMIEQESINIKNGDTWCKINPFPIGYIYLSYTNTSPATTYGGTWSAITGRFLYCNAGTATDGSNDAIVVSHNHTASTSSAGAHTHNLYGTYGDPVAGSGTDAVHYGGTSTSYQKWTSSFINSKGAHTHTVTVASKGSSGTGKNMPAYQTVYAWRRTA